MKIKEMETTKNVKVNGAWKTLWSVKQSFTIVMDEIPLAVQDAWKERGARIAIQASLKGKFHTASEVVAFFTKHGNRLTLEALQELDQKVPRMPTVEEIMRMLPTMTPEQQDKALAALIEARKQRG